MTAFAYLREQLEQMAFKFPFSKYSYEYDKFSGIHIIQVEPLALYNFNDEYKTIETKISIDFDNTFYPESVLFISTESLNQVENPELEIHGLFYGLEPIITYRKSLKVNYFKEDHFESENNNYAIAA